jgi:hypothetical protein
MGIHSKQQLHQLQQRNPCVQTHSLHTIKLHYKKIWKWVASLRNA